MRCLEKKPEDRFADVVELEAALAGSVSGDGWSQSRAAQWWAQTANSIRSTAETTTGEIAATTVMRKETEPALANEGN